MAKVYQLKKSVPTTVQAVSAFLDTLESSGTRRVYGSTLSAFADEFQELDLLAPDPLAAWFLRRFGETKPATWNRALATLRSAVGWWRARGWLAMDPTEGIPRRKLVEDRSRALSRADIAGLLDRKDVTLREKVLWRMLYETAARAEEVLQLDVEDLDLPQRSARVRRKGGDRDIIVWQKGTALLLPRLLKGRKLGPVFLTERRAPAGVGDAEDGHSRLSYRRAAELFEQATGGWTLHQLRHSALTHDAEDGMSMPMLKVKSGHRSDRSLLRYARPSADALRRWQREHDPARRR